MLLTSLALCLAYQHPLALLPRARRCATPFACADGPDPEEWRAFRAKLISGGLRVTGDEDGGGGVTEPEAPVVKAASVAPKNEELLKSQNEELWTEYLDGAWAHVSPGPEAGGLVCRLPLQAQLTRMMREQAGDVWSDRMREQLLAGLPTVAEDDDGAQAASAGTDGAGDGDGTASERLVEQWSSNTVYMYRLAERLISGCPRGDCSTSQMYPIHSPPPVRTQTIQSLGQCLCMR